MEESRKTLGIVFSRAGPTHWHATDGFSSVGRRGGKGVRGYVPTCQLNMHGGVMVDAKLPMGVSAEPAGKISSSFPSSYSTSLITDH